MSNPRTEIGEGRERILYAEVDGNCPLCSKPLQYEKEGRVHKRYEKAHIYPLNPTKKEIEILKNEDRLGQDVNDMENIILLCLNCHEQFDKPRTIGEYRKVFNIKKKLIHQNQIRDEFYAYTIEDEINHVITSLYSGLIGDLVKLEYKALKISDKTDRTLSPILKRSIINDVSDFYISIKDKFKEMDKDSPGTFDLIASQIKVFYLKSKKITNNQEEIYSNISQWLYIKTEKYSLEACKILVSFFVQNCEVFS